MCYEFLKFVRRRAGLGTAPHALDLEADRAGLPRERRIRFRW